MPPHQSTPHGDKKVDPSPVGDASPRTHVPSETVGLSRLSIRCEVQEKLPPRVTVHLVGELDADTAPALRETLAAFAARSSGGPLVLDLSGITFCDTAGLYTLLGLRQALPLAGVDVILTGAGAELRAGATRAGLLSQLGLGEDS